MIRLDSTQWKGSGIVLGLNNFGIPAEDVPSTGENGPSPLYNHLAFPGDNGVFITWFITRWPTNGTLNAYDDGSFSYIGNADSFDYEMYKDGILFLENTVNLNNALDLNLSKSDLSVSGKILNIQAAVAVDLIKSQAVIVGKQLSLSVGLNNNLIKSQLNTTFKQLNFDSAQSFNGDLTKLLLNIESKTLVFEETGAVNLQKSSLNVASKALDLTYGSTLNLSKSAILVNSKLLSIGTVAISLPADRIFVIPRNETVFSVPVSQRILTK